MNESRIKSMLFTLSTVMLSFALYSCETSEGAREDNLSLLEPEGTIALAMSSYGYRINDRIYYR
jgi:hypothetical protein